MHNGEMRRRGNRPPRGGIKQFLGSHKDAASSIIHKTVQKIRVLENESKNGGEVNEAGSYCGGVNQYENQGEYMNAEVDSHYVAGNEADDPAFSFYQSNGVFEQYVDSGGRSAHIYPFDLQYDDSIIINPERSIDDENNRNPHIGEARIAQNKLDPKEEYQNIDKATSNAVVQSKLRTQNLRPLDHN